MKSVSVHCAFVQLAVAENHSFLLVQAYKDPDLASTPYSRIEAGFS